MSTVFACLITGLLHRDLHSQDYRLLHDLIWHLVQSLSCLSKESRFCTNNFTRLCSYVYFYSSVTVIHPEITSMLLFLTERTTAIRRGTRHTLLGSIGSSFRCMNYTNNPLRYYTLLLSSQLHQAFISQAPWTHTSFSRYLGLSKDKGSFRHQSSFVSAHPGAHLHTSAPLGNRSHLIIIMPHCLRRDAVLHTRGKMAETRALQGIVRSHIAHPRTMFRYNGSRCEPRGVGCHNDDKPTHSLL